jgi:hypothetical protein
MASKVFFLFGMQSFGFWRARNEKSFEAKVRTPEEFFNKIQ